MDDTPRIIELRKKLEKDPGSRLFAQLAEELRKEQRFDEAIEIARAGLEGRANYPSARLTLARALMDAGRPAEARPELEQVVRGAPDNILAGRLLGEALEELGDQAGALKQFEQTLRLSPSDKPLVQKISDLKAGLASASAPAAPSSPTVQVAASVPVAAPPLPSVMDQAQPNAAAQAGPKAVPVPSSAPAALDRDLASGTFSPGTLTVPADLKERYEQSEAQPAPVPPPEPTATSRAETIRFATSLPSVETPPDRPPFASDSLNETPELPSVEMPPEDAEVGATTLPLNSVTLADLYLQQGLKAEATAVLSQVIKEEPQNEEARSKFAAVSAESVRGEGPPASPAAPSGGPTSIVSPSPALPPPAHAAAVPARAPEAAPPNPPTRAQIRDRSVASLKAFLGAVEREAAQQRATERGAFR